MGTPEDEPSVIIHHKLTVKGQLSGFLDTTLFPGTVKLSFDPCDPKAGWLVLGEPLTVNNNVNPKSISLADIRSVYRRWSRGVLAPPEPDPVLQEAVYWNLDSAIGSFFRCMDCLWVNPQEATEMHNYKGYQLKLLQQAGLKIPETLITNQPEEMRAFYERLNQKVIYKPVRGWAYTELLKEADFAPENLTGLSRSPVKLQEYIPGTDIRAYVVGNDIFAMEIQSQTLDFREDTSAQRVRVELPDSVMEDCLKLAQTLGLVFTGIDLRRTPEGEYVFFEGNPTPVFVYDEQASGYPISDRLVDMLIAG